VEAERLWQNKGGVAGILTAELPVRTFHKLQSLAKSASPLSLEKEL